MYRTTSLIFKCFLAGFVYITSIVCFSSSESVAQGGFRAAVVKVNITPDSSQQLLGYAPRMSDGVRDSIYHKVVIMDDGHKQFVLASTDLARVSPSTYEKVADGLKKLTDIEKEDFWWTFTHTHSAPLVGPSGVITLFKGDRYKGGFDQEYAAFVEESLIQAIIRAREKLAPARLGVGWGYSRANINRRARDIDKETFLGENPDGPVDRRIGLIRIDDEQGSPVALISNYPIHGTVLPTTDTRISGDVAGVVSAYVEQQTGAPLLFINGAEGNIAPHYSVSVSGGKKADKFLDQFRALLGDKIIEANNKIVSTTGDVTFKTGRLIVQTPMADSIINKWPEELSDYAGRTSAGIHMIHFPVSFLFINDDIAIWGTPCELFCEISNHIRDHSPFPYTFYYGLTNGSLGYLPTKEEMGLGGYEPSVSPFSLEAGKDVMDNVLIYLEDKSRK